MKKPTVKEMFWLLLRSVFAVGFFFFVQAAIAVSFCNNRFVMLSLIPFTGSAR